MKKFAIILAITLTTLFITSCTQENNQTTNNNSDVTQTEDNTADKTVTNQEDNTVKETQIEIIKEGTGEEAKVGDTVSMHYVGTLEDGTKFDSSRDRGTPFQFTIGRGMVIKGWEKGIPGMKVGEIRKLTIPSNEGYGAGGRGSIPPNATLIFEVELLEIL